MAPCPPSAPPVPLHYPCQSSNTSGTFSYSILSALSMVPQQSRSSMCEERWFIRRGSRLGNFLLQQGGGAGHKTGAGAEHAGAEAGHWAGNGYWLWELFHVPSHVLLLHVIWGDLHQTQGGGAVATHQGEEAEHAWVEAGHWLWELYFRGETEVVFFDRFDWQYFFSGGSWCRPSSSSPGLSTLWCRPPPPWKQGWRTCCLWLSSQFEEKMFMNRKLK